MTRTLPNRVATHTTPTPPVAYADAIAGAVAFLHAQLRNSDVTVGMTAAMALLDLEKTRMRHGQPIPQIAAGLPAGVTMTEAQRTTDSPPVSFDGESPAGKPAAIWETTHGKPVANSENPSHPHDRADSSPRESFPSCGEYRRWP